MKYLSNVTKSNWWTQRIFVTNNSQWSKNGSCVGLQNVTKFEVSISSLSLSNFVLSYHFHHYFSEFISGTLWILLNKLMKLQPDVCITKTHNTTTPLKVRPLTIHITYTHVRRVRGVSNRKLRLVELVVEREFQFIEGKSHVDHLHIQHVMLSGTRRSDDVTCSEISI